MTQRRAEWSKPTIILAILTLAANLGWALYGMSQKTASDLENRLRTLEITVSRMAGQADGMRR